MSPAARIGDLLTVMRQLIEVMERETDLLRNMKPAEMQDLQRDKIVLAAAYEAKVREFDQEVRGGSAEDPEAAQALAETAAAFRDTLARNQQALRAARETTDRVLKAVVREVEKERSRQGGYGASGQVQDESGAERPISLAVDQRL